MFGRGDDVAGAAAAVGVFFRGGGAWDAFAGDVAVGVDVVVGTDVTGAWEGE